MNDYYICVRRFVASDPELPDSLYFKADGCQIQVKIFFTNIQAYCTFNNLKMQENNIFKQVCNIDYVHYYKT